jgi:cation transport ATPase
MRVLPLVFINQFPPYSHMPNNPRIKELELRISDFLKKLLTFEHAIIFLILAFLYCLVPPSIHDIGSVISAILPDMDNLFLSMVGALLISFVSILSFHVLVHALCWSKNIGRDSFFLTVDLMIVLFVVGGFLIAGWFGNTSMDLRLKDSNGDWVGNLSCQISSASTLPPRN